MKSGAHVYTTAGLAVILYLSGCSGTTSSSTASSPGSIKPVVVTAPAPNPPSAADTQRIAEQIETSDNNLARLVQDRLVSPGDLPVNEVHVAVHDRAVTLTGTVGNFVDQHRIDQIAKNTEGVQSVTDQLQVKAADRPDADIQRYVTQALQHDPALAQLHIHATVKHGVVTLEGLTSTWQEKDLATTRAEEIAGVRQVTNNIHFVPNATGSNGNEDSSNP